MAALKLTMLFLAGSIGKAQEESINQISECAGNEDTCHSLLVKRQSVDSRTVDLQEDKVAHKRLQTVLCTNPQKFATNKDALDFFVSECKELGYAKTLCIPLANEEFKAHEDPQGAWAPTDSFCASVAGLMQANVGHQEEQQSTSLLSTRRSHSNFAKHGTLEKTAGDKSTPEPPSPNPTAMPTRPLNSRFAIIGAGPAGLHMASRLKQLGYTNVVILEKTGRVGGKSYTIYTDEEGNVCEQQVDPATGKMDTSSCVAHEMGTCYLHNGYHHIRQLVKDYGLTTAIPPEGRAVFGSIFGDENSGAEIAEFVGAQVHDLLDRGVLERPGFPWSVSDDLTTMKVLLDAVKKYNELSEQILGEYKFTMPDRMSAEKLALVKMTFQQFLESNGCHALVGFFGLAQAAQGYGYVSSIPAYYGLVWMKPEILNGFVQQSFHMKMENALGSLSSLAAPLIKEVSNLFVGGDTCSVARITTMLPEGYNKIWKAMYEQDDLNVRFDVTIAANGIDRQLSDDSAPIKITYSQPGQPAKTEEFDYLMYTAPHALANQFVSDIADDEAAIFADLKHFVLMTTLYTSDAIPGYSTRDADKMIFYDVDALADKSVDGDLYCDRDDRRIFTTSGDVQRRITNQEHVSYQFYEDPCAADDALCSADKFPRDSGLRFDQIESQITKLRAGLERYGAENVNIKEQFPWPYFWHFSQDGIDQGLPWALREMQGQRKTFWLGASAIFESVHDVTNYNLMILDDYFDGHFQGDGELWILDQHNNCEAQGL